eukprot:TRINITY_DN9750_c0_g1_i1.p1 TRINITY_DN9750_c0_g1~~TRINITY_DN9750_c0_g1_i1.p1  ORF type:complete len:399 (+),score=51.93 TRINITY_DN9750_c0_g1_i1:171-1367(+)
MNHKTWRLNPKFTLKSFADTQIMFFLERTQLETKTVPFLGLYIFRLKGVNNAQIEKENLVFKTRYFADSPEVYLNARLEVGTYVILPCTYNPGYFGSFALSVFSSNIVKLEKLKPENVQSVVLKGSWVKDISDGGCTNFPTWRNNTQFLISVNKSMTVNVVLEQDPVEPGKSLPHIGVSIFRAPTGFRNKHLLNLSGSDMITRTKFVSEISVTQSVHLTPDMGPAIIIPSTFSPGETNQFSLSVSANDANSKPSDIIFKPILTTYSFKSFKGVWSIKNNTAGGCVNNRTWLQNPKFALVVEKETEVRLILTQPQNTELQIMGFYVLKFVKSERGMSNKDIMGKSEFSESREVQCSLKLSPNVYVVLACTFEPRKQGSFEMLLYSDHPCQFVEVPVKKT